MTDQQPAPEVFAAFGAAAETPQRLAGGRGLTWRAGGIVIRPSDDPAEADWKSEVLAALEPRPGFRAARPVATMDGSRVCGGWEAWQWLPGEADPSRVVDVIRAGCAFHEAIAHLERPAFIDSAEDAWSQADRMAWGESATPRGALLDRLAGEFLPVRSPSQVVHGDLLGNVLFAPGMPPAVIDWAPYWRPAGFGAAVAAADAACWHGWPLDRLAELGGAAPEWRQLLVRALVFRIATLELLGRWDDSMHERHEPVVTAVLALRP